MSAATAPGLDVQVVDVTETADRGLGCASLPSESVQRLERARGAVRGSLAGHRKDDGLEEVSPRGAVRRRPDSMTLRINKNITPSAEWPSPISAQRAAAGRMRLTDVQLSDLASWIRTAGGERGRCVIVRRA